MEYWEALQAYYELKARYMHKVKQGQDRVVKQDISVEERKKLFSELRPKCEKCKREGGTLFFQENHTLMAKCGNPEPCSLDIQIYTGKYTTYPEALRTTKDAYEKEAHSILEAKYDLLFQYVTETDVKSTLSTMKQTYMKTKNQYDTEIGTWTNIISNPDILQHIQEEELIIKKKCIQLKDTLNLYKKSPSSDILRDMILYYKTDLLPSVNKLRQLKYRDMHFEFKTGAVDVYSDTIYSLKDLEITLDPPKVIAIKI